MKDASASAGWRIERSIAQELDVAIYLSQVIPRVGLLEAEEGFRHAAADLVRQVPREWLDDLRGWAESHEDWLSVNEHIARWAGVLYGADYEAAAGAMRHLTPEAALEGVLTDPLARELAAGATGPPEAVLVTATQALEDVLAKQAGLQGRAARPLKSAAATAAATLVGGSLHDHFWHWMDRFYYGVYRNWRETRSGFMADLENEALRHLGSATGSGPPRIDWLSAESPLAIHGELRDQVESGNLRVVFWVEPFGLASTWTLMPGVLAMAFAEPGTLSEQFTAVVSNLATLMKALADPTRLRILRLIRHFDLDNTQIASYLDVSRPTVSVHARVLREAGLITTERSGRQARHSVDPEAIQRVYDALGSLLDVREH